MKLYDDPISCNGYKIRLFQAEALQSMFFEQKLRIL